MNAKLEEDFKKFLRDELIDTDIFCFQEVYANGKPVTSDILKNYNLIFAEKNGGKNLHFAVATFIKKDLEIVATENLLYEDLTLGLGVYVKIRKNGKTYNIGNFHGMPQPGDKLDNPDRIKQSEEVIKYFSKIEGVKIIGGDFNLLPETKSIKLFERNGYKDLIKDYKIDTTRNKLAWKGYSFKQYYADYVFISPDIKVTKFSVPKNEISDHLPMILELD